MSAMLRISAWILALALVCLPVVAVLNGWIGADRWPLTTLRVVGDLEWVDDGALREAILPHAQHGFFAMRLDDARADVARLPWVEHAEVRKRWPDVVEIHVDEHRPFAHWGETRLLSEQGRLFDRIETGLPAGMPLLHGPESRVADIVAMYNQSNALFNPLGHRVASLVLDNRGSWVLTFDNGTEVIVGGQSPEQRLQRFARLLPQLQRRQVESEQRLARADLRYSNGFALTWTDAVPDAGIEGAAADVPDARRASAPAAARRLAQFPFPPSGVTT